MVVALGFVAASQGLLIGGFLLVMLAFASFMSFMMIRAQKGEADNNQQIASQQRLRFIHRPATQPGPNFFSVFDQKGLMASNIAVDPNTADMAMQVHYYEPNAIQFKGGGQKQGTDHNVSIVVVTSGFWLTDPFVLSKRYRLSRKVEFVASDPEFQKRYTVFSHNPDTPAAVFTPAFQTAFLHPPVELKNNEDLLLIGRGPQMLLQCQLVEFEKRIELMRWMQHLVTLVDTRRVPDYGQVIPSFNIGQGNQLPQIGYIHSDDVKLTLDPNFNYSAYIQDDSSSG